MEHNNSGIVKQQNNEYKELVEKVHTKQADNCTYNQQSLKECGSYIQDDNVILQSVQCSSQIQPASFSTSLVSNHSNQEYTATEQNLNAQTFIKIEPVASPRSISPQRIIPAPLKYQANSLSTGSTLSPFHSQVITAAVPKISDTQENEMKVVPKISDTQENEMKVVPKVSDTQENEMKNTPKPNVTMCANLKPIELTKSAKSSPSGFRAVEFVLKNLDSVPGEEKFYSWSDKAKDFANTQLSEKSRERLKISSNIANSNNSQSTSVVMAEQTDLSRDKPPKRKSSSRRMNKVLKNANWAAEKDRTLKKYANHLMRKKPKSWQLQERIVDEDLSPYI